jgi:hypothetical protein
MELSRAPQPFAMVAPPSDAALTDALVVVAAALLKARRAELFVFRAQSRG